RAQRALVRPATPLPARWADPRSTASPLAVWRKLPCIATGACASCGQDLLSLAPACPTAEQHNASTSFYLSRPLPVPSRRPSLTARPLGPGGLHAGRPLRQPASRRRPVLFRQGRGSLVSDQLRRRRRRPARLLAMPVLDR